MLPSFAQLYLRLTYVITHFEQAKITATKEFSPVQNKACFFHLSQSYWQRTQNAGLATQHGFNPEFNLKLYYLQALAFIPIEEMPTAFDNIKDQSQWNYIKLCHGSSTVMLMEESYTFSLIEQLGVDKFNVLPQVFTDAVQWNFPMYLLNDQNL